MTTHNCVSKLFFATMNDVCKKEVFRVALDNDGRQICERELSEEQQAAVNAAFVFFNTPTFESAYAIDFDGGCTDGISRAAIHHDTASE